MTPPRPPPMLSLMATTDDTLRALLDQYLDTIRFWVGVNWRHSDFYRHRKNGKHLSGWHEHTARVRNAIHHVRALRRVLGIRPRVTMTHAVGDVWRHEDGSEVRTVDVGPHAIEVASLSASWVYEPRELPRSGWRRVNRGT